MENNLLEKYVYTGISGHKYIPEYKNGSYYIGASELSLYQLALLLRIEDEEELTILALTYGP